MCHTHTCKHSHMQSVCDRIECVGSNASEQIMCDDCFCESENMTARRLWHSLRACERRYRAYNMLVGVRVHKNDTKKNMIVCVQPFSSVWCISYRNYTRFFFSSNSAEIVVGICSLRTKAVGAKISDF